MWRSWYLSAARELDAERNMIWNPSRGVAPTDVSKPAAVKALFAKAKKAYGRLDLLFNNAGIFGSPAL